MIVVYERLIDRDLDTILDKLLKRAADTNSFINV